MGYKVKESKILFLDSRAGHQVNHKSRINFPTDSFSAKGNELIRLTLLEFNMRRNFYNINSTNNRFYIRDTGNSTDISVDIPEGNYETGTELAVKIEAATNIKTCTFDVITQKFTITLLDAINPSSFIFFLKVKGNIQYDYDTHYILGGIPSTSESTIIKGFDIDTVNTRKQISKYPIQLQTINNILLKTNLQTNNFQSKITLPDTDMSTVVN
jgi:hypothetical protein